MVYLCRQRSLGRVVAGFILNFVGKYWYLEIHALAPQSPWNYIQIPFNINLPLATLIDFRLQSRRREPSAISITVGFPFGYFWKQFTTRHYLNSESERLPETNLRIIMFYPPQIKTVALCDHLWLTWTSSNISRRKIASSHYGDWRHCICYVDRRIASVPAFVNVGGLTELVRRILLSCRWEETQLSGNLFLKFLRR